MRYFLLIFTFLVMVSCSQDTKLGGKITQTLNMEIKDSVQFNVYGVNFQDLRGKNILFFNHVNNDIITYDLSSGSMFQFNKVGEGYNEYKKLLPNYIRFLSDSLIGVGTRDNIRTYKFNGDFVGDIPVEINRAYTVPKNFYLHQDSLLICHINIQGNPTVKSFYKKIDKIYLIKNILTGETKKIVDFPLAEEAFKNDEFFVNNPYDFPDFVSKDGMYTFTNSNGKILYKIDIRKKEIIEKTPIDLINYNPLKIKFGENLTNDNHVLNLYRNSDIWDVFETPGYRYILYSEPYSLDFMVKFKKEHKYFPYQDYPKLKFFLARTSLSSGKTEYFNFSNYDAIPICVLQDDTVVLQKLPNEVDELNTRTVIYLAQLISKEAQL